MPKDELKRYTDAVIALRNKVGTDGVSVFENFAVTHAENVPQAHRGAYFCPWHRQMLHEFEIELNKVASPGPAIGIPYWDFTTYNTQFTVDPIWRQMGGAVSFQPLPSAPFKDWSSRHATRHSVVRGFTVGEEATDTFVSADNIATLIRQTGQTYASFNAYLESIHNSPHATIDGDMGSTSFAANDPIFYSHHAYVDMIWRLWQQNGGGNKFGGTDSDDVGATLDRVMNPYGRTVRSILEGISTCVRYESAGGPMRQATEYTGTLAGALQEAKVEAAPITFNSVEEKRKAQLKLANAKVEDPGLAILKTREAARAQETNIAAMRKFGFSEADISRFIISYKALELKNAVDVKKVTVEKVEAGAPPSVIKEDGEKAIEALSSGLAPPGTDDSDVAGNSSKNQTMGAY
jgi:Common central domain of tyrosinase